MKLTIKDARAQLAVADDSLRQLCTSIIDSWSDCETRLSDAEADAEGAREEADDLLGQVGNLERKIEALEPIPALVDKILGHEDAVSESLDIYNLRRAIDDIRSL